MKLSVPARRFLTACSEMLFPSCCEICGRSLVDGEQLICLHCRSDIPRAVIHNDRFNTIHRRLASPRIPIERAAAYMFYYRDNPYSDLIRKAKYNSRPSIARILGADFAVELKTDSFFDDIDILIPVPLHRWKMIKRGYNQSEEICKGISSVTSLPIGDNLHARYHPTQTRKNAYERSINAKDIMSVKHPEELTGKHILIVDDVITTGATLLSCAGAIAGTTTGTKISVLTLGATHLS